MAKVLASNFYVFLKASHEFAVRSKSRLYNYNYIIILIYIYVNFCNCKTFTATYTLSVLMSEYCIFVIVSAS